ncbi:hypothetical protein CC78DRAFT_191486 [Lojkania enalia]|uniref:Uncharacterized protein n=1 Tax=Lojkania enalia TaxID=147567 RepID=A0A9P4NBQ4_9PLEO|nr:hypothetical protein CC78DRAFT_191486 [Didymosphaeria enalia]
MAPISLVLVAGLLALSGVDCRKDKVRISQWVNAKCEGHTAPEKQLEPKDGQCVNMDTASIRFHAPLKSKYAGWIHEADHGIQCGAIVYDKPNCPSVDNNKAFHKTDINLPAALENDCVALPSTIKSVKFMCGNVFPPPDAYSRVRVHTATSWHLDDSNRPVPSVYRVMESVTGLTVAATSAVQAISPRNEPALEAASESSQDDTEEEREIAETKHHRKLMWLNHPFAASLLCFECWTKHEKKFKKFKCESGMDTAMDCGPNPMETFCHTVAFISKSPIFCTLIP